MKKNYWYIILLIFFIATVSFVVIKYKNKQESEKNVEYILLPRNSQSSKDAEWIAAKNNVDKLLVKLKINPTDTKSALALANAYIIEARVSGNITYYDKAAMKTVDAILLADANSYEALMLRSLLQLSQHHFADGLATAQAAVSINPNSAFVYGLLVDANIEMGHYDSALDAADKMITIRPDLRSYSRIAYLREIYGDYRGAIDAMKLAVAAGLTGEESTEWCRVQLARLYENTGDKEKAYFQYQLSLAARPGYAYAFAGLGRIASAEEKYDSAIHYFEQAADLVSDLGIREYLAIAYKNAGRIDKANALNKIVINEMNRNARAGINDPTIGHYSDKELAYAYLQNNDYDKAMEHALAEYNRRPKNIDVNETIAWVYYKRNEFAKALPYVEAAMVTNSRSPQLLCIAGLVYSKTGNSGKGKAMMQAALKHDPVMQEDLKKESMLVLQKL